MYKILISGMAYDAGKSGISDYINNVTAELVKDNKVDLMLLQNDVERFPVKNDNLNLIPVCNKLQNALINMLWHLFVLPGKLKKSDYDFIFLPAGNRRVMAFYPKTTLITFHDLSQFHIEAKYDKFRMFYIKKVIPYYVKLADKIMVISKNTKDDLVKYYKLNAEDLVLNYNGYNSERYNLNSVYRELPLNLKKEYFLYIARIEHPGKNHLRLVQAYELLPQEIRDRYDLVIAGKPWSGSDKVLDYIDKSPVKDNIHLPGFVPDEDMPELYRHSALYVFPSLYEGFGIPLIEAMASGIPVICSNTSSLPEIGGEAVALFDPYSIESIRDTIQRVITDHKMQDAMVENGLKRVKEFSWKKHSDTIIKTFEAVNGKRK